MVLTARSSGKTTLCSLFGPTQASRSPESGPSCPLVSVDHDDEVVTPWAEAGGGEDGEASCSKLEPAGSVHTFVVLDSLAVTTGNVSVRTNSL